MIPEEVRSGALGNIFYDTMTLYYKSCLEGGGVSLEVFNREDEAAFNILELLDMSLLRTTFQVPLSIITCISLRLELINWGYAQRR